jgi:hypothetical protein
MNLKRLAVRLGVLAVVAATLGGCCVLPFGPGHHGGYRGYGDDGHSQYDRGRPGPGRH